MKENTTIKTEDLTSLVAELIQVTKKAKRLLGEDRPVTSVKDIIKPVLVRRERVKQNRKERII